VAVDLSAQPSAANFQSQQFRSSLAEVLHARFDDFAEVKTGGAVIQLPGMSCSLSSHEKIASYLCSAPASSRPEAEKLYNSLTATLTASLPGYPLCPKPAKADDLKVTRFCHYPTISIADASVRIEKNLVSLEVFGRGAGDRGEPAGFLHGFSLAELGRHADALKALEPILGPGIARRIYEQERFAYDAAVQATQDCPTEQNCAAAEFLAIGNTKEASLLQNQVFKSIELEATENRKHNYKVDPVSARTVALAEDYDLRARILAAQGKLSQALFNLDLAYDALPSNAKAAARKAIYAYHRALILAEAKKYAKAAKACRESLGIDASLQEQLDQPQCIEIDLLASGQPEPEAVGEPMRADSAADSAHDPSIQAEIDEAAGTNNYSALPQLTESRVAPEQDRNLSAWVVENGTQYMLHVLMSGPSDRRIDVAPANSTLIALPPGKYRVAAVLDRSGTLLFYGEQTLQPSLKYTSNFIATPN
jgi:tetratricopeptide (TPR) repeat protein